MRNVFKSYIAIWLFTPLTFLLTAADLSNTLPAGFQRPIGLPQSNLKRQNTLLYYSTECQDEIREYCPRSNKVELNDINVLQCILNDVPDLSALTTACQNLLYQVKKNLTINIDQSKAAQEICQVDLKLLPECTEEEGKHMSSCLLNHQENITQPECQRFISAMSSLIFTDFRLIENFVIDCSDEIDALKCGRIERVGTKDLVGQQGKTIECLQEKFRELKASKACAKQVMRITELQSKDFHLDRRLFFACREDRERFCSETQSGRGRVYKCLKLNKFKPTMSEECRIQLTRRQRLNVLNIKTDQAFVVACSRDLIKHKCVSDSMRKANGDNLMLTSAMLCLENVLNEGEKLDGECVREMVDHRRMLMEDYELSPNLVMSCEDEIRENCGGGLEKGGKTLHCLFGLAKKIGEKNIKKECLKQLRMFMKVVNPAENIQVDPSLYASCQKVLERGVCKNVQSGHGRMVECLTRHLNSDLMDEDCSERLLEIQFFVARDWTLNAEFYEACRNDASRLCGTSGKWYVEESVFQAKQIVLPCLFHHLPDEESEDKNESKQMKNIKKKDDDDVTLNCASVVREVMQKRALSIQMQPSVQDTCAFYLAKLCSSTEITQKGQEIQCLQDHYASLDSDCRAEIKSLTKAQNDDIRFDQILYKSCLPSIEKYCSDKRNEKNALLECLISQKNQPDMQVKCRVGIEHHQILNLNDVTLNFRFYSKCKKEIIDHCKEDIEEKTKLEIVFCLSELILNDTLMNKPQRVTKDCKQQLRFELLQTSENINLDPDLANTCEQEIADLCKNVKRGKGEVIECLRSNEAKLGLACRSKLYRREKIEIIDEASDYSLQTHCKPFIEKWCHLDSSLNIVQCLKTHLNDLSMSVKCRTVVINRLIAQNKDVRLNGAVMNSCQHDISKQCNKEFARYATEGDEEGHGLVIQCLKKNFLVDKLSKACTVQIGAMMQEAANIDYRLDPILSEACLIQIESLCADEPNDRKENCLRLKFQHQKIDRGTRCYLEVKRIIIEGAADVFVDHELSNVCEKDLARFCVEVAPGAAQHLKCLMEAQETNKAKFSRQCSLAIEQRRELWRMAKVGDELDGLKDLATLINESESRNYLFASIVVLGLFIFVVGMFCRPLMFRSKHDKRK